MVLQKPIVADIVLIHYNNGFSPDTIWKYKNLGLPLVENIDKKIFKINTKKYLVKLEFQYPRTSLGFKKQILDLKLQAN